MGINEGFLKRIQINPIKSIRHFKYLADGLLELL